MLSIWFAFLLGFFGLSVQGLKCHSCSNLKSYEQCLADRTEEKCIGNLVCAKFSYNLLQGDKEHRVYGRACQAQEHCKDAEYLCRSSSLMSDCEIFCCDDKDMCNAGMGTTVSGLLLATCALYGVMILLN